MALEHLADIMNEEKIKTDHTRYLCCVYVQRECIWFILHQRIQLTARFLCGNDQF